MRDDNSWGWRQENEVQQKLGVEAWEQSMTKAWSRDLGTGLISKIKDSYVSNRHTNTTGLCLPGSPAALVVSSAGGRAWEGVFC